MEFTFEFEEEMQKPQDELETMEETKLETNKLDALIEKMNKQQVKNEKLDSYYQDKPFIDQIRLEVEYFEVVYKVVNYKGEDLGQARTFVEKDDLNDPAKMNEAYRRAIDAFALHNNPKGRKTATVEHYDKMLKQLNEQAYGQTFVGTKKD